MVARASKEKKAAVFPLDNAQPVKINVSTTPRKYCPHDLPIPPQLEAAAHQKMFSLGFSRDRFVGKAVTLIQR